ncbi:unnamed protein product [Lactuca virosa]|uniref:UvrD-like helicase ATP-binding domain-containing protein n=1 Tax=Lactuca virosa TaxID=75947 RepID=A0AAU9MX80_9ASTR|nr:unnamed protein product [Lactuca virosa]
MVGIEMDLHIDLTSQQDKIISLEKTTVITRKLGIGKTTILKLKLCRRQVSEAGSSRVQDAIDDPEENKASFLRQPFVTVSPNLCAEVKQYVSRHTSISSDDPETFVDIPRESFPLIITFEKLLLMLDHTPGESFFDQFNMGDEKSSFIRSKNVTYDIFLSHYWPHLGAKKLDASRVFTEIMSHIKGGLQAAESVDRRLNNEAYFEGRSSTLSKQTRELIYAVFQSYEELKTKLCEFDWGYLVNDLQNRFQEMEYGGDYMDFVYIDEAQDLSMRSIILLKKISRDFEQGFMFVGDSAHTVTTRIEFKLEDIRSLQGRSKSI